MAKCPNCGGELHPQENGLWKCAECGKLFRMKQKTPPESDMNAGAPQAQTPPASERNVIEPPVQTEPSAPADEAQTAEIEELKRRLAAMEKQQTEKTAGRGGAAAGAAAAKFAPVIEFLKKYGLKVVLPVALLVVAFVTLCACFMGLRGIYVNVNDPNEFISFTATDYEWYYNSILGETVDKGKWSKSGNTIDFVVNDEFFGEVEDPYEVTDFSWDGFTLLDAFGAETRYERVSLICYKDNISKVTVSFDLNGGSGDGGGEQKFNIGTVAAEPETPTREGYIFRGWYTTADSWKTGKGRSYRPGAREWKSATYYANWQSATQFEMYCEYFEDEVEPFYEGESLMDVFKRGFNEDGDASNDLFEGIYFCEGSENGWTIKPLESDIAPAHNVRLAPTDYLENFTIIVDGKLYVVKDDASEYSIPGIVTDIGGRAFSLCDNLTTITIGNGVTSIENEAFYGCGGLTSITIPDRVTSIGDGVFAYWVFAYCRGLTSVIIGSGVTSIGQDAFRDCIGLTSITIPDDVTSIGDYAFMGCYKLIEVYNKSSLDITAGSGGYGSVGNYAKHVYTEEGGSWFSDTEDGFRFFYDGEIGYLVAYLGDETELTLPENFTAYDGTVVSEYQIYDYAFRGCDSLTSVTIGNSVTSIGDYAFYSCDSLTSVTIGNSVTSIGDGVFAYGLRLLPRLDLRHHRERRDEHRAGCLPRLHRLDLRHHSRQYDEHRAGGLQWLQQLDLDHHP